MTKSAHSMRILTVGREIEASIICYAEYGIVRSYAEESKGEKLLFAFVMSLASRSHAFIEWRWR